MINNIYVYSSPRVVEGYGMVILQEGKNEIEQYEMAKKIAYENAISKAGVYVRSFTKVRNGELSENDIKIITYQKSNIINLKFKKGYDVNKTAIINAAISIIIDDDELKKLRNNDLEDIRKKYIYLEGETNKVIDEYNRISKEIEGYNNYFKGNKYQEVNDCYKALEYYNKAIECDDMKKEFYIGKGNALMKMGDYIQSLEAFDKAIELDSKSINSHLGEAKVYIALKEYRKAIIHYNIAYTLDNNNEEAIAGIKWIHEAIKISKEEL